MAAKFSVGDRVRATLQGLIDYGVPQPERFQDITAIIESIDEFRGHFDYYLAFEVPNRTRAADTWWAGEEAITLEPDAQVVWHYERA